MEGMNIEKLKQLVADLKNDLKKADELKLETAAFIIKLKIEIYEDLINL